jgi:YegS/Rv2252/BmrU family lipid kinase
VTRALLITNPAAARAAGAGLEEARRRLVEGGLEVEIAATSGPGDAERMARDAVAADVPLLVAHGGDGTAMEVAAVLVGTGRPLGLLPAGTGNLLAGNLGIRRSPRAAAEVILQGSRRVIDVGRLVSTNGTRYFAVAAGAGFDAELMRRTASHHKRAFGMGAYVATAAGLATAITRAAVKVEVDGAVREARAATVLVANCGELIPGVLPLGPRIAPDDGLLDVVVLDAASLPGAARVALRLLIRRPDADAGVTFHAARRVTITADPVLPVQADGEAAGYTPLSVQVVPSALTVLAPPREGAGRSSGARLDSPA